MYDGIVFDNFGTLLDVYSETTARANALNLPSDFVSIWRENQLSYTWLRTCMGRYSNFWKVTLDALNWTLAYYKLTITPRQKKQLMYSWLKLKPFDEIKDSLEKIQKVTQNIYIFSDGTPQMLEKGLKFAGIRSYFKKVLSVDAVKTYKPNPRDYSYLERQLCIPKEKLLFVSGTSWETQGAKSYGFSTVWINRNGLPSDNLGFPADYTYASLTDAINTKDQSTG
jgi:2-haloacid dehalogenase